MSNTTIGAYDVVIIRPGEQVGVRSPKPHKGAGDLVEIWQTGQKRERSAFVNRFTRECLTAETGVGRVVVQAGKAVEGEVSREPATGRGLEGREIVTHERPRDLTLLDLHPTDLDWSAVREWLATQE